MFDEVAETTVHLGPKTMEEALVNAVINAHTQLETTILYFNSGQPDLNRKAVDLLRQRAQDIADLPFIIERLKDRGEHIPLELEVKIKGLAQQAEIALNKPDLRSQLFACQQLLGPRRDADTLTPEIAKLYPDTYAKAAAAAKMPPAEAPDMPQTVSLISQKK